MKIRTESTWNIVLSVDNDEARESCASHCFEVAEELVSLERPGLIADSDVWIDFEKMTVTYAFDVEGESITDCQQTTMVMLRTAIHAAHGNTPGWEEGWKSTEWSAVEDSDLDHDGELTSV